MPGHMEMRNVMANDKKAKVDEQIDEQQQAPSTSCPDCGHTFTADERFAQCPVCQRTFNAADPHGEAAARQ